MVATATFTATSSWAAGASALLQGNGSLPGEQIPLTGAQVYNVDLEMMPGTGCKALVVSCDLVDANQLAVAAPVTAKIVSSANAVVHVAAIG